MEDVEVFTAWLPGVAGKHHRSRWKMTREEAAARGGEVIENTREMQRRRTTAEEMRHALPGYHFPKR